VFVSRRSWTTLTGAPGLAVARIDVIRDALVVPRTTGLPRLGGHQLLADRGQHLAQKIGMRLL
jgi:hypothetical protein